MRAGGGKRKGSKFERSICRELSRWITKGVREDVFWRSSISGGRATVALRKGIKVRQAGDICAVAEEGNAFCDQWFIECKHLKSLKLDSFLIQNTGRLAKIWKKVLKQAKEHNRDPMLIAQQNGWPPLVITRHHHLEHWTAPQLHAGSRGCDISLFSDMVACQYEP